MNQNGGIHKGGFAVLCHRNGGSESPGILTVTICDNGPGYPAYVLDGSFLQDPNNPHIGIENVRKRLALLYQEEASLILSNLPGGGAQTRVVIPIQ